MQKTLEYFTFILRILILFTPSSWMGRLTCTDTGDHYMCNCGFLFTGVHHMLRYQITIRFPDSVRIITTNDSDYIIENIASDMKTWNMSFSEKNVTGCIPQNVYVAKTKNMINPAFCLCDTHVPCDATKPYIPLPAKVTLGNPNTYDISASTSGMIQLTLTDMPVATIVAPSISRSEISTSFSGSSTILRPSLIETSAVITSSLFGVFTPSIPLFSSSMPSRLAGISSSIPSITMQPQSFAMKSAPLSRLQPTITETTKLDKSTISTKFTSNIVPLVIVQSPRTNPSSVIFSKPESSDMLFVSMVQTSVSVTSGILSMLTPTAELSPLTEQSMMALSSELPSLTPRVSYQSPVSTISFGNSKQQRCQCKMSLCKRREMWQNLTRDGSSSDQLHIALDKELLRIQRLLKLSKSNLSVNIRKKTCAVDHRTSSKAVGYVGIIVILTVPIFTLFCDLSRLIQFDVKH